MLFDHLLSLSLSSKSSSDQVHAGPIPSQFQLRGFFLSSKHHYHCDSAPKNQIHGTSRSRCPVFLVPSHHGLGCAAASASHGRKKGRSKVSSLGIFTSGRETRRTPNAADRGLAVRRRTTARRAAVGGRPEEVCARPGGADRARQEREAPWKCGRG